MGVIRDKMKTWSRKLGKMLLLLIPAFLLSIPHLAADSLSNGSLASDQKTDLDTGAIEPADSVKSNPDLIYVLELLLRAPVTQLKDGEPPYDQEPPDAQEDFRTRTEPPVIPTEPPVIPTEPPTIPTNPPVPPTRPPDIPRPSHLPPAFPGRPDIPTAPPSTPPNPNPNPNPIN